MLDELNTADKVVGTRRLVKAIAAGQIKRAYVARDADLFIARQVTDLCEQMRVPVIEVQSMKALGEACGVDVKTAAAGIKRA